MDAGDWISLFMALIACASTLITYVVYRSATDPEIIVFAEADEKRPSIIQLIIKNIGKGPATDITFYPSKPLPHRAFGIQTPKEMPTTMNSGPIIVGIPYLAPGQTLVITWGQYGGLKKYLGNSYITMKIKYKRTKSIRPLSSNFESICKLDISQFECTDASDHNWGPKLVKAVEASTKELSKIRAAILESEKDEHS